MAPDMCAVTFRLIPVLAAALAAAVLGAPAAHAEDGYDLWLRYRPLPAAERSRYAAELRTLAGEAPSPTLAAARRELERGLGGLLGMAPARFRGAPRDGEVLFGTPKSSPEIARLRLPLGEAGAEGYVIRRVSLHGHRAIVIAADSDVGVLYGAFGLLRLIQTGRPLDRVDILSRPALKLRLLDHWDNLDRTIERGYAGESLWDWPQLPERIDPRYVDYARADASIGLNGAVLNNVNADARILTHPFLRKAAALADAFRPYGVRVYLTARFSAPVEIGGLPTADPLDPRVRAWWRAKADEIYRLIPDFGGFQVKANSEGQPGPQDYGRNHADGANMMAEALAPHGGVVIWRAFVYSQAVPEDRAKQAYLEFRPLDGRFAPNVMVQVKNGAIDFQPREPFHPLFGAMAKTPLVMEFQVTKEYLGQSTHLVYLGPLYEEVLKSDTFSHGPGSTVAKVLEAGAGEAGLTGMAGVGNIGSDRDWTGSIFNQANWYVLGRLAWDPTASSRDIAEDWVRMTFGGDPRLVAPVVRMMMSSRETAVNYMTPLGLHHIMARDTHFGPGPWVADAPRADWNSIYYHRADAQGIGFDRTASGSNAVGQYFPEAAAKFASLAPDQEKTLLWFHHLPWDYRTASGRTLWDELVVRYTEGAHEVKAMRAAWERLRPLVDKERFEETDSLLRIQEIEAEWWRDACIAYFQSFSHRPIPAGYAPPAHPLAYYEARLQPPDPGD
jgi:alpha-glucuronidase